MENNLILNILEDYNGKELDKKIEKLESKFKVNKDDLVMVDFLKIIDEFNLKNYDINIKPGHGNILLLFKKY